MPREGGISRGRGSVTEAAPLDPGVWGEELVCSQSRVRAERMGSLRVGGQGCEEAPLSFTAWGAAFLILSQHKIMVENHCMVLSSRRILRTTGFAKATFGCLMEIH